MPSKTSELAAELGYTPARLFSELGIRRTEVGVRRPRKRFLGGRQPKGGERYVDYDLYGYGPEYGLFGRGGRVGDFPRTDPTPGERFLGPRERYLGGRTPSGGGSADGGGRQRYLGDRAPKHDDGGHSLGGFLGNVADVGKDIVLGAPRGLVETVRNPVKTAKAVGRSYADYYGPLLHGDFGRFAENVYEDPWSIALDSLAVASLGVGAAAAVPGRVGASVATAGKAIELSRGAGTLTKASRPLSRKPLRGYSQLGIDKALRTVTKADTPLVGEFARAGRADARAARRVSKGRTIKVQSFEQALGKLRSPELRTAAFLLKALPDPELLDRQIARYRELASAGDPIAARAEELWSSRKVRQVYDSYAPGRNRKLDAALAEMDRIAGEQATLLGLPHEIAQERAYLPSRLASGAEFRPLGLGDAFEGEAVSDEFASLFGGDVGRVIAPGELGLGALVRPTDRGNVGRVVAHDPRSGITKVHFVNRRTGAEESIDFRASDLRVISPEEASRAQKTLQGASRSRS